MDAKAHWEKVYTVPLAQGVSGGAWLVDQGNHWGLDGVGFPSNSVDYYRQQPNVVPCQVALSQAMYIDSSAGPTHYTTNSLTYTIYAHEVCGDREPPGGTGVPQCVPY